MSLACTHSTNPTREENTNTLSTCPLAMKEQLDNKTRVAKFVKQKTVCIAFPATYEKCILFSSYIHSPRSYALNVTSFFYSLVNSACLSKNTHN